MSLNSKVVWSEGMFLNPQHFQQQERYLERLIEGKCAAYGAYGWGLQELEVDQQLLGLGKVSIVRARGVFPDGTPFSIPEVDEPPAVFDVPENLHNAVLHLCVPVRRPGALEVMSDMDAPGMARFQSVEQATRDVTNESGESVTITVGKLRLRLLLDSDDLGGYASIGIMRIAECRQDRNISLDEGYIPTCLDCGTSPRLSGYLSELKGLLHHRGEAIAARLGDTNRGGTAEIADYMLLQLINRLEPVANHMSNIRGLHPIDLYAESLQMVGELSTFVAKNRRTPQFPAYLHDNLQATFTPVIAELRKCLSMVYEQTAVSMKLVEKKYGIRVAEIVDRSLIDSGMFVLAARADVAEERLRVHLPAQLKIGPVERIRQLVNAAMPGVGIRPLPVAPRQIPYRAGFTYFQLDPRSPFWTELKHSGGFALHVGGDFPGLEMEFWAIRQK